MSDKQSRSLFYSAWGQEEEIHQHNATNQIKLLSLLMNFNHRQEYNQDISNTQRTAGVSLEYNNLPLSMQSIYNTTSIMNISSKQQSKIIRTKSTFLTQFPNNLISHSRKHQSLNQFPLSKAQLYYSFNNSHDKTPLSLESDLEISSKKTNRKQLAGFRFQKKVLKPIETRQRFKTPTNTESAIPFVELSKNSIVLLNLLKKKTNQQPIYRLGKEDIYQSYSKQKQYRGISSSITQRKTIQK